MAQATVLEYHPVAGQPLRRSSHGVSYAPGISRPSSETSDLPIGNHFPRRDLSHDFINRLIKS